MQVQYHAHFTKRAARDYNQIKLDCYTVLEMVKRIHGCFQKNWMLWFKLSWVKNCIKVIWRETKILKLSRVWVTEGKNSCSKCMYSTRRKSRGNQFLIELATVQVFGSGLYSGKSWNWLLTHPVNFLYFFLFNGRREHRPSNRGNQVPENCWETRVLVPRSPCYSHRGWNYPYIRLWLMP